MLNAFQADSLYFYLDQNNYFYHDDNNDHSSKSNKRNIDNADIRDIGLLKVDVLMNHYWGV